MKKVDVIMSADLNSIIGPVQTIKRIKRNHDYFLENGYDIEVFTSNNFEPTTAAKIRGSKSPVVKALKKFAIYLSTRSWIYSWYRVRNSFISCHPLLKSYSELNRKPDMIVFHSMADFYVYMKHYRIEGVKTACFTHSDGFVFKMLLSYYPRLIGGCVDRKLQNIANYLMTEVDVKPCIAKIEEKNLLAQYPQLKGKTCLVVNAIDDLTDEEKAYTSKVREQEFPFKYRLVCAGGVHRRKGQYTVVTALNELTDEQLKDFHLTIVGDGTDRPVIEQYVKDNPRLTNHVEILGAVKNTEVYTKLAKCNIMVLMSGLEGLPIALIEGLRSGLALISTKVSGIPELIDEDVNGKLLNPNKEELVSLFKQFENYDWERMSKESRKLFEEYYVFTRMRSDYLKMLKKAFNE